MNIFEYFSSIKNFDENEYENMVSLFGKGETDNYLRTILFSVDNFNISDSLRLEIICYLENIGSYNSNNTNRGAISYISNTLYSNDASVLNRDIERKYAIFLFNGRNMKDDSIYFIDKMGTLIINQFDTIINVIINSDGCFRKKIMDKLSLCVKEGISEDESCKFYQLKKYINDDSSLGDLIVSRDILNIDSEELLEQLDIIYNYRYARNQLILHNRRLVFFIAKKIYNSSNYNISFEDIYDEGIIGLMRAIASFDYHYNDKFSTYAVFWIRSFINRMMAASCSLIYCPPYLFDFIRKADKFINDYLSKYGIKPTDLEVANKLDVDLSYYLECRSSYDIYIYNSLEVSRNKEFNDWLDSGSILSLNMEELIFEQDLKEIFNNIFSDFDDRCIDVVKMYFGIYPYFREYSLREISSKYNLSRTRIRQIREYFFECVRKKFSDSFDGYVAFSENTKKLKK